MTTILAVIDPGEQRPLALERCRELPPDSDLEIHAVLFVHHESASTFAQTFQERSNWLTEQVAPYVADGYKITTEVVPFSTLYESVIEVAQRKEPDFVLKPMRQHSLFSTMLRTSTDWNLIRHCPYPLLLVSHLESIHGKPVLAALDVLSGDGRHDELNSVVLGQSIRLARVLESDCAYVNAFRVAPPIFAVGSIDVTPIPAPADLARERETEIDRLIRQSGLPGGKVIIEEGSAPAVINEVARKLDAGVIVLGTVARRGLDAALIGNTAEGVLEGTGVDVLVVKLPA